MGGASIRVGGQSHGSAPESAAIYQRQTEDSKRRVRAEVKGQMPESRVKPESGPEVGGRGQNQDRSLRIGGEACGQEERPGPSMVTTGAKAGAEQEQAWVQAQCSHNRKPACCSNFLFLLLA